MLNLLPSKHQLDALRLCLQGVLELVSVTSMIHDTCKCPGIYFCLLVKDHLPDAKKHTNLLQFQGA